MEASDCTRRSPERVRPLVTVRCCVGQGTDSDSVQNDEDDFSGFQEADCTRG